MKQDKEVFQLETKINTIEEKLTNIDQTLTKQHLSLEKHIYRTDLAEKRLEHIETVLVPVQKHISQVDGALKVLGAIVTLAGATAGIVKLFF